MPQAEYIIQTEHTSGNTAKHYHGVSISTLNEWAKNNISPLAVVSNIEVLYSGKLSLGDTKFYVGFTNNSSSEPGQKIISDQLTTTAKTWREKIPEFSGRDIKTSYSVLSVYMNSGIIYKKFTCYNFKVIYTYHIPSYTITVNAGAGGTVSGGGEYLPQGTPTLGAEADIGYKFVGWIDQSGTIVSTSDRYSFTVTGNATYTAQFEPITFEVTVESLEGQNGATATISGAGQYKFGDTITIKADIPPYHKFDGWNCFHSAGGFTSEENPLVVTLNESFCKQGDLSGWVHFRGSIDFTGYTLKANVSPDNSGVVELGYGITENSSYWSIPDEGQLVGGFNNPFVVDGLLIRAVPNKDYEFVQWTDGVTANPRSANLTGDATFTAIFRELKTNDIYIGTTQPTDIYVGTNEVKAVYVGTKKVYG